MSEPKKIKTRVIQKHATAAVWKDKSNFTPLEGELVVYDKDTSTPYPRMKIGDGQRSIDELPFINAGTADKLTTVRKITLLGAISGSVEFDGSGDVSMTTQLNGEFSSTFTGTSEEHNHTFTGKASTLSIPYTPQGSVTTQITPKGSVSAPNITVSPEVKQLSVVTNAGTAATYTPGQCTFPTLVGEYANSSLEITMSGGSYTPGEYIEGAAPSSQNITYIESLTASASAPTFTGTSESITSTLDGESTTLSTTLTPEGDISSETVNISGEVDTKYTL